MFGGCGHTTFDLSITSRTETVFSGCASSFFFFFLSAKATDEIVNSSAAIKAAASILFRAGTELCCRPIIVSPHQSSILTRFRRFPSLQLFYLRRSLWQPAQNSELFAWSFASKPGFAEACG